MGRQYIYPADLKSEPKLWLWSLKDLAALGIALILSVLALTQIHLYLPLVGAPSMAWNRLPYFINKRKETGRSYYSAIFERTANTLGAKADRK